MLLLLMHLTVCAAQTTEISPGQKAAYVMCTEDYECTSNLCIEMDNSDGWWCAESTDAPSAEPTVEPTAEPTVEDTDAPTMEPTKTITDEPTSHPTHRPSPAPAKPTKKPTLHPTYTATDAPTMQMAYGVLTDHKIVGERGQLGVNYRNDHNYFFAVSEDESPKDDDFNRAEYAEEHGGDMQDYYISKGAHGEDIQSQSSAAARQNNGDHFQSNTGAIIADPSHPEAGRKKGDTEASSDEQKVFDPKMAICAVVAVAIIFVFVSVVRSRTTKNTHSPYTGHVQAGSATPAPSGTVALGNNAQLL
jgi:hypothetical protein